MFTVSVIAVINILSSMPRTYYRVSSDILILVTDAGFVYVYSPVLNAISILLQTFFVKPVTILNQVHIDLNLAVKRSIFVFASNF